MGRWRAASVLAVQLPIVRVRKPASTRFSRNSARASPGGGGEPRQAARRRGAAYADRLLLRSLVRGAGAREDAPHRVVAFMAGIFVDRLVALQHWNDRLPGLRPHGGIIHGELVGERIGSGAGEPLDQVRVRARACDIGPALEIDRVHDEGVALPMTARRAL